MAHGDLEAKKATMEATLRRIHKMRGSLKGKPSVLDYLLKMRRENLRAEERTLKRSGKKPQRKRKMPP